MTPFLAAGRYVDHDDPRVSAKAASLASGAGSQLELVRRCFEFVRDEIRHSADVRHRPEFRRDPVTCRASDVLRHGTGYCYAKSHLLAALLRANGIPAGLCYQRLSVAEKGPPYCLHGLNAVHLDVFGWYRVDARGNKPGVDARFSPPVETLAFAVRDPMERDLPEIRPEPLQCVIDVLESYPTVEQVLLNLPDVRLLD